MQELSHVKDAYWHKKLWRDHDPKGPITTAIFEEFGMESIKSFAPERLAMLSLLRDLIEHHRYVSYRSLELLGIHVSMFSMTPATIDSDAEKVLSAIRSELPHSDPKLPMVKFG